MKVPITRPFFDDDDRRALLAPLETGWVVQGPHVATFERDFAAYTGARHAAACTSCTTALHLALAAAGIGPGDEVLVPALTWVATANAVLYVGATPVLCDVALDTFTVDLDALEARITPRTRAIIPVHLFGLAVDMPRVMALAAEHDLRVVEDAACGLDARVDGRHVGTWGDYGAFSFHPRKAITTGEGGMVTTADPDGDATVRALRDHGAVRGEAPQGLGAFDLLGFNYRMTDFQGALGVTQLAKARWIHQRRSALADRYAALLSPIDGLRPPVTPAGYTHGWQAYVCLFAPEAPRFDRLDALRARRDRLMAALAADGVQTRPGTHAVHTLGLYRDRLGTTAADCPRASLAEGLSIALPLYPTMTEAEQDHVVDRLAAHASG